jgi:hypothetical protein
MPNMRNLLNLMESVDDDLPLSGSLDPKKLAEMLPELTDVARFVTAMQKVRRGDAERLTLQEKGQFALAFLSLLKGDRAETIKAMRKLMMVQAKELNENFFDPEDDEGYADDWAIFHAQGPAVPHWLGDKYVGPGYYIRYIYDNEFTGTVQGPFDTEKKADSYARKKIG